MKNTLIFIVLTLINSLFGYLCPIVVDLVGSDGKTALPDSAFCTVVADGDTILSWTAMDTIGRSAHYDFDIPDSIWLATAIVAAFWEDSLADTTAFTIPVGLNPKLATTLIEDSLSLSHGDGNWQSTLAMPFLLTMSEEEFLATFGGAAAKPIVLYRGDSKTIDFTVLDANEDTVDITDAEAIFTAREGESDTTAIITDTLTITDGSGGVMRLELKPEQTTISPKSYAADIQLTMPDSTVATVWRSRFIVRWDVTR